MAKPTIALVPGAWHTPGHFELFLQRFRDAGYPIASKALPSVGADSVDRQPTTGDDADFIRNHVLLPELDQGREVVVIVHSYGGCPGSAAAQGLSKAERAAAGKAGGVIGLVFMCAFIAHQGKCLLDKLPGNALESWHNLNEETGQISVIAPRERFFNDINNEPAIEKAIRDLQFHAFSSLKSPSPATAWADSAFDGRRVYLRCHRDKAIPLIAQQSMLEESGVAWRELDLEDAGHSPFLSHVDVIFKHVDELTAEWMN